MREKWILATKRADFQLLAKQQGISPVLARLMVNRGIDTTEKIETYLHGTLSDLHSPWDMKGIKEAVEQLVLQKEKGETVAISSDFDCDGIFSGFILKKGLEKAGLSALIFTPERVAEGYGLNRRIIDEAQAKGATMILTCDNGIAAVDEIAYAKEKGMKVIVTDHHEPQDTLPTADVIVDPKQEGDMYPYDGLCGAGVAFKLIMALYERLHMQQKEAEELLQYVAIATVADVMDLTDENRILVREGLNRLSHTDNVGIQALICEQNLDHRALRGYHIGFVLGPCFNASGRLQTVDLALNLLEETDPSKARKLAAELKQLNDTRKSMTEAETTQACNLLEKAPLDSVILLKLQDCHESLVGIIAGRIKEKYHRPTIVFTNTEDGRLKGSGRSIEAYNMFEELLPCKDLMVRFGGHKMAAGLTIETKDFDELKRRLNESCMLTEKDFQPEVLIDIALPIERISDQLLEELELLEPLGKGNAKPVFAEQHFTIHRASKRGKEGSVLVMNISNRSGCRMDAILFGKTSEFEEFISEEYGKDAVFDLYAGRGSFDVAFTYYPSVNEYRGYRNFQIQVSSYCRVRES